MNDILNFATRLFAIITVLFCAAPYVSAQDARTIDLPGRPRDVALSRDGFHAYVALQDTRELLKVSVESGEVTGRYRMSAEPSDVALSSSGDTVAVLSSASKTLTILRTADLTEVSVVQAGEGARQVAGVPGGGFAIANAFADSVTLVPGQNIGHPATVEGIERVPNGVAASDGFLAVTTRTPPALLLFGDGNRESGKVALPEAALAVSALPDDRFAVASSSRVLVIDARTQEILHARELTGVTSMFTTGSQVVVLAGIALTVLDERLTDMRQITLDAPATAIAGGTATLLALVPADKRMLVQPVSELQSPIELAATPIVEETSPPVVVPPVVETPKPAETPTETKGEVEAETLVIEPGKERAEPSPVPESGVEAEQVEEKAAPAPEPVSTRPTQPDAVSESSAGDEKKAEEVVAAPEAAATPVSAETTRKPARANVRKVPLGGFESGAPHPRANRPSPFPTIDVEEPTLSSGIAAEMQRAPVAPGFEPPDWTQPLKNLKANKTNWGILADPPQPIEAQGDVSFSLGTLAVKTDYLYYDPQTGDVRTEGNVELAQAQSTLTADRLYYTVPLELPQEEQPSPLLGAGAQELERQRLISGAVDATNIHLVEPDREIHAEHFQYDLRAQSGEAQDFEGRYNIFYFGGQRVRVLGPASVEGEEIWVTTCDHDPPHYKVRLKKAQISREDGIKGSSAQMEIGKTKTPFYWPRFKLGAAAGAASNFEFDSGRRAVIGYYVNVAQTYAVTQEVDLGIRLYPTTSEGIGFGIEGQYNYMNTPASPLFRSQGEFRSLATTKERGYYEWYHRQEFTRDLVLLAQTEQWSDEDFYKDFYYEQYRDRSEPRTFANLTYTQPGYLATGTISKRTNAGIAETEKAPEFTFHLLERELAENLYFTFDTVDGYAVRKPSGTDAVRSINVARLTYDWNITPALSLTPFYEAEVSWYSDEPRDDESNTRFSNTVGATLQTRFHKVYPGAGAFSGFKHIVVPSLTYSYRPEPTMGIEETPRFDAYDNVYGRSRIESKIDNIVLGKDAETEEVWQVARLTLYQGTDFWNELRKSEDYEAEIDIRPRPWYGFQTVLEHHGISNDASIDEPFFFERAVIQAYEEIFGRPVDTETALRYNAQYGDYDRVLSYLYYDDRQRGGAFNARIGFAYTETQSDVFNREILYGAGYQLGEKWGIGFEHRYDFERDELTRQEYEIRRNLHCWEASLRFKEREEGWDLNFQLNLVAFPGAKVKF